MVRLVDAIFENGVFRPLEALPGLGDKVTVRLRVEEVTSRDGTLADFCGIWTKEEADAFEKLIEGEFEKVDPRDWH